MAKAKIRLDHAGLKAVLTSSDVARAVRGRATAVADAVDKTLSSGEVMPVFVNDYKTDRAKSVVVLAHPAALRSQAKHGTLTKAASAAGLEVNAG